MATIVDIPLDDDEIKKTEAGSEAGAPVKTIEIVETTSVQSDWGPTSFKLAAVLWVVCSFLIATLDYYEGGSSDTGMVALMALSVGLFAASGLYLSVYVMRWMNNRSKQQIAGATPIEVAATQGIIYV